MPAPAAFLDRVARDTPGTQRDHAAVSAARPEVPDARARILADFDARPVVAAQLIASTLSSSDAKTREVGRTLFGGPAAEMRKAASHQVDLPAFAVLRADDGRVLLHSPAARAR